MATLLLVRDQLDMHTSAPCGALMFSLQYCRSAGVLHGNQAVHAEVLILWQARYMPVGLREASRISCLLLTASAACDAWPHACRGKTFRVDPNGYVVPVEQLLPAWAWSRGSLRFCSVVSLRC